MFSWLSGDRKVQVQFQLWMAYCVACLAVGIAVTGYIMRPVKIETVENTVEVDSRDIPHPGTGWIDDQELISTFNAQVGTIQFSTTPAARAVLGDDDRYLWRAVRLAGHFPGNQYPNVDQKSVGCCVGCGWKHILDVALGIDIQNGNNKAKWKPVSVEVIYAGSRVDIGGGKLKGDGSVGAWAKEFVMQDGIAPMEEVAGVDLSVFSPDRARQWGKSGMPAGVKAIAKQFPIKAAAQVKSAEEGVKALQQDYPIAICSNVGFANADGTPGTRDQYGFVKPRGNWGHCMAAIAYRKAAGAAPAGVFILNSWGDSAHKGPVVPPDAPVAGFWCDIKTFDKILKQNDSYAVSSVTGFPAKKLGAEDWYSKLNEVRPLDVVGNRTVRIRLDQPTFPLAY